MDFHQILAALESFLPILALSVAYKVERIQFREVLAAYIGKEPRRFGVSRTNSSG